MSEARERSRALALTVPSIDALGIYQALTHRGDPLRPSPKKFGERVLQYFKRVEKCLPFYMALMAAKVSYMSKGVKCCGVGWISGLVLRYSGRERRTWGHPQAVKKALDGYSEPIGA